MHLDLLLFADDLIAVHWTFCNDSDVARLAETGTWLGHCPASMSAKGPHPLPMRLTNVQVQVIVFLHPKGAAMRMTNREKQRTRQHPKWGIVTGG